MAEPCGGSDVGHPMALQLVAERLEFRRGPPSNHGVLAPHAGWRARVVGYCARGPAPVVLENATANASGGPAAAPSSRHWPDAIRTIHPRRRVVARAAGPSASVSLGAGHQPDGRDFDGPVNHIRVGDVSQ